MTQKKSKKELRLERALAKKIKQQEKSARLSSSTKINDRIIRSHHKPDITKIPRLPKTDNYKLYQFSWCHTRSDTQGCWQWGEPRQWNDEEFQQTIEPHMVAHRQGSWSDVESKTYSGRHNFRKLLNKYQPLCSLCKEAQKRWLELEFLSQFEELFRLRLGTDKRIWGIRIQHHFFMVWYERNHKICPPKKK